MSEPKQRICPFCGVKFSTCGHPPDIEDRIRERSMDEEYEASLNEEYEANLNNEQAGEPR